MNPRALAIATFSLGLIGAGAYASYSFETTPGQAAPAPTSWPADSALMPSPDGATLVMFAHPECTCTEASLSELAGLLTELPRPPRVIIVFSGSQDPHDSANWRAATQIVGASVRRDDGREATRFGARTSGHVMVYDANRTLRFSGGVTESRGHAGDNMGRRAVLDALYGRPGAPAHGVFGCALESE